LKPREFGLGHIFLPYTGVQIFNNIMFFAARALALLFLLLNPIIDILFLRFGSNLVVLPYLFMVYYAVGFLCLGTITLCFWVCLCCFVAAAALLGRPGLPLFLFLLSEHRLSG
jgi:hypothetical protein